MKKLFALINFASIAVFLYEIYFLITNGTAGNVQNIVIVMVLGILFIVKFFVKSAINTIKFLMVAAIIWAVVTHVLPLIA